MDEIETSHRRWIKYDKSGFCCLKAANLISRRINWFANQLTLWPFIVLPLSYHAFFFIIVIVVNSIFTNKSRIIWFNLRETKIYWSIDICINFEFDQKKTYNHKSYLCNSRHKYDCQLFSIGFPHIPILIRARARWLGERGVESEIWIVKIHESWWH